MWYLPEPAGDGGCFDDPNATCNATCYATSCDGIRWEKSLVGTLKAKNGKPTGRKTQFSAAVGLVTWPLDRFVSAAAGSRGNANHHPGSPPRWEIGTQRGRSARRTDRRRTARCRQATA